MSELDKTFSFDLQRFATVYLKWDNSKWQVSDSANGTYTDYNATSSVAAGDTLKLAENASGVTASLEISKSVTLDLGGKTITSTGNSTADFSPVKVTAGETTIKNGAINITDPTAGCTLVNVAANASLILDNNLTLKGTQNGGSSTIDGITCLGNLTVNKGASVSTDCGNAVYLNASSAAKNLIINGGTIKSSGIYCPVYYAAQGTFEIHGGTISYTNPRYDNNGEGAGYAISMSNPTAATGYTFIMDGGEIAVDAATPASNAKMYGGALEIGENAKSVEITGGKINSKNFYGICAYSNANISGNVTITGKNAAIVTHASKDHNITVTIGEGVKVTSDGLGICNYNNTKFVIESGATVTGAKAGVYQTTYAAASKFGTVEIQSGAKVGGKANVAVLNAKGAGTTDTTSTPVIKIGDVTITDDNATPTAQVTVSGTGTAAKYTATKLKDATFKTDASGSSDIGITVGTDEAAITLDAKGEVTGFTFGGDGDKVLVKSGTPDGFKFTDAKTKKDINLSFESDEYQLALGANKTYTLTVGDGTEVTLGNYKVNVGLSSTNALDLSAADSSSSSSGSGSGSGSGGGGTGGGGTGGSSGSSSSTSTIKGFDIGFTIDDKGKLKLTTLAGTSPSDWKAGDVVEVEGSAVTKASEGVKFGSGTDIIAVASGKFAYGIPEDADTTQTTPILTLKNVTDTVYASGSATKVAFDATGEGKLELKNVGTNNLKGTYDLNIASEAGLAYFDISGTEVKFNFGGAGDAITLPKVTSSGTAMTMTFTPEGATDATTLTGATVKGSPYKVTFTDDTTGAEVFTVNGLEASASVFLGKNTTADLTFGKVGGGEFLIGNDGSAFNVTSVTVAEGDTLDFKSADAVKLLDGSSAESEDGWFKLNGTGVNISSTATTLTYNDADKSLTGVATGDQIINAGDITKIVLGAKGENIALTFGDPNADSPQSFTVTAKRDKTVFFTVDKDKATDFTFANVGDKISGNFSSLKLHDGADDTEGFAAPKITTVDDPETAKTDGEIEKVKTGFQITAEADDIITFGDGTKLTFETLTDDATKVVFDNSGALVSITGVKVAEDSMIVTGATGAVSIDGAAYEITGGEFTYGINADEKVQIKGLKSGVKVVQSGNAKELWTALGTDGNGEFAFGSASAFTISGADNDTVPAAEADEVSLEGGVMFQWNGTKVTGIASIDENTSIAGALKGLTFNGKTEALDITDGTYTVFGAGMSLAGLKDGAAVVKAGGISDLLSTESGKFTIFKASMSIANDADGVVFKTDGKVLTGIESLAGSAAGDFTGGLSINSVAVKVTGDNAIKVVGNNEGVTEIRELGGTGVEVVSASGASLVGANADGDFTFTFAGGQSFALKGNKTEETTFTFENNAVTAIDGLDDGEIVAGSFSTAIKVDGKAIEITGDNSVSIQGGASSAILGLTGGASVVQSGGVKFAVTDSEGQFTFKNGAFSIAGDKEVTFVLDADGNVTGINGVADTATVSGALNGVAINEGEPFDIRDNTNYSYSPNTGVSGVVDTNTVQSANGASSVWVSGTDFTVQFSNGAFSVAGETDGVNFLVKDKNIAIGVESLDAGATMSGDFTQLTTVNGVSFAVKDGDNSISIVGGDAGITQILGLTAEGVIENAGGASLAKTDKAGKFTFGGASGVTFETADDNEVTFGLNAKTGAVETISGLSGAVKGDFKAITGINDKNFDVKDSDGILTVYGNETADDLAKIAGVTADATIGEVGSVSQVITDKAGKFEFTVGGQSFITGDGADVVTFGLSSSAVTAIDNLNGSAIGGFSGIKVNGADIDIVDGDGQLKVFGDGKVLTAIQDVDADATINKAGGVAELVGNIAASSGTFTFANSGEFKVEGDSSVTFALNTAKDAEVVGISDLNGAVTGSFSGISAVNGKTFSVVDADGVLTVYGDGSDITKIAGVTGSASIGQVGGVSQILTDKAGAFAFTNGSWSVAGDDEVTFGMSSSKVVSIAELVGTVEGAFEDVTVNGKAFKISGDSSIALVGGASGVTAIEKLSGGADIARAEGYLTATTDSEGTFTFANGRTVQILGDSSVVFGLENGLLMSIDDLDETATIIGAINNIAINGSSSMFDVRNNANLWYSNGTLSAVVDGNTVVSADGATTVQVATDGTYTFGNGAFQISGDQDGAAQFTVSDSSIATAINGVDAGATVTGDLNGMAINGGVALQVENDNSFGAVAGASGLAKLINLSDGANVVEAGGASQFVTDAEGQFTILGTAMQIESDDEVTFTAGASGITAIDGLAGTATGDFQKVIAVNTNDVQVLNDSVVAVSSEGAEVTAINQVSDGATVAAVGGAAEVGTDTEGSFTFAVAGDSQAFTVEEDSEVTFQLEDGVVVGVNELEEGKLTFDTATTALTLNDDESFTIQTSTNASFSVADNSVNYVTGVDGAIEGLVNATVVATGAMEVNGTNIDVQDDNDFKVIVQDGEVVGLADISGGAKVNVAGVSIAVDTNGELEIGGKQYSFTDSIDGAFNLTTGDESALTGVDAFAGEMVIAAPADQALTVNGDALGFLSTADSVTVNSDGVEVTAVNGLVNNDAVTVGAGASIAMPGSTASVRGEGAMLTVNEVTYELLNDDNGVTVTGGRQVTDLNESASLFVSEKGKYTVNGNGSDIEVEDTNMPIIGLDNATDAYIYDPAHLIVRKSTPVGEIETMLGLPTEYETKFGGSDVNHENDDPNDDPLNSAGLSAMFANADLNQPLEIFATNDEKTAQDIPLAGTDFSKKVHLFRGDQNVTFNNAGGNLAVVESESSGTKNIALGDMGDAVISKADAGDGSQVNVVGGAGDDSVVVQGSAPVNFDMSEGGADKLVTFASSNARIALSGYDALANPNAGVHIAERWASLADAITAGLLNFANGVMSIGTDPNANAQIDLGTNIVNLFNYLGQKQAVGFTNSGGGLVDASTAQEPVILIGNDKGQKTGNSILLGGSGDDTAIAGGGDSIDLGAGNNEVRLQQDINREGADVTLAQGRTLITGFIGSFNAQHGDVIKTDLSNANVSFDGTNVVIEGDGFYGVIADAITNGELSYDAAADVTESADLVESADSSSASVLATAQGDYTNVLFDDEGVISKTAIAQTGGTFDVKLDFDARANNYIGDNSGITFYDHTGEVLVNLAQGTGSIDTEAVTYSGINKVAAGAGQTTMIGGESNETLIAGQGNDSIWGAGGKNLLRGYNDVANDKTGQTSFFVVAEADGAANTVRGFNFVDDDSWNTNTNQITADKLDIQVQYDYIDADRDVDISGDDVVLFVNNRNKESSESVVIEGARGKNFVVSGNDVVNDVVAQVNTDNLVANKFANYFVATGKNATLTVGNDIDTANIYLGGRPIGTDYIGEVPQFYGDIHVIDASGSNAKVELGGNLYDNTIIGGTGDASLWGGDGGNDLLVGGTGANTFFYNAGDDNDTITGAHDGDVVDLTNVQLSDIVDANSAITSSGVELKFKDGGSLTVNSTADVAYKVGEDTYVVNDDRDSWTKK